MTHQKKITKLLQEGLKALDEKRTNRALELFTKATRLDPTDTQAWNNRGVALRRLGEITEAIKCYNKALAIDPTIIQVLINKARALKKIKALDQALLIYENILELEPKHLEAIQELKKLEKLLAKKKKVEQEINEKTKKEQLETKKITKETKAFIQYLEESQQSITDAVDSTLQKQKNAEKDKQAIKKERDKLIVAIQDFDQQTLNRAKRIASEFQFYNFFHECQEELASWNKFIEKMIEKLHEVF